MRRIFLFLLCCFLLTTAVSAAGSVTDLQSNTVFASDGSCNVTLTIVLTVEGEPEDLRFPLPGSAKDISLNGDAAKISNIDGLRWVNLSSVVYGAGTYTITLHYSLPELVTKEEKGGHIVTLPLLSGFSYPIDRMEFSITFPGEPTQMPHFTSTYYPESMDTHIQCVMVGNTVSGYTLQGLKDHESLTMQMEVPADMFPQAMVKRWSLSTDDLLQYGLLLLAFVYWLIFLRSELPRRARRVQPPDGLTAGELGCCVGSLGVDFPLMVLSWAQMGYLTIQIDRHGRVILRKVMDMGNERSEFEMRCFKTLFGRRTTVDGGSEHFARLSRKASKTIPGAWHYFKKSSGNPMIFRLIAALSAAVAGYSLAVAFAADTAWQVILAIFLVPLSAALSWLIQTGMRGIHLRYRLDLFIGIGACILFLILSLWCGEAEVAIFVILSQSIAGAAAIHGGRRTDSGLLLRNEILGLRKYLRSMNPEEVNRNLDNDPDYYFTIAPVALAMGVDQAFSRQFGKNKLMVCPYLEVSGSQNLTARQWNERLRHVVRKLEERQRKYIWQKLLGR